MRLLVTTSVLMVMLGVALLWLNVQYSPRLTMIQYPVLNNASTGSIVSPSLLISGLSASTVGEYVCFINPSLYAVQASLSSVNNYTIALAPLSQYCATLPYGFYYAFIQINGQAYTVSFSLNPFNNSNVVVPVLIYNGSGVVYTTVATFNNRTATVGSSSVVLMPKYTTQPVYVYVLGNGCAPVYFIISNYTYKYTLCAGNTYVTDVTVGNSPLTLLTFSYSYFNNTPYIAYFSELNIVTVNTTINNVNITIPRQVNVYSMAGVIPVNVSLSLTRNITIHGFVVSQSMSVNTLALTKINVTAGHHIIYVNYTLGEPFADNELMYFVLGYPTFYTINVTLPPPSPPIDPVGIVIPIFPNNPIIQPTYIPHGIGTITPPLVSQLNVVNLLNIAYNQPHTSVVYVTKVYLLNIGLLIALALITGGGSGLAVYIVRSGGGGVTI